MSTYKIHSDDTHSQLFFKSITSIVQFPCITKRTFKACRTKDVSDHNENVGRKSNTCFSTWLRTLLQIRPEPTRQTRAETPQNFAKNIFSDSFDESERLRMRRRKTHGVEGVGRGLPFVTKANWTLATSVPVWSVCDSVRIPHRFWSVLSRWKVRRQFRSDTVCGKLKIKFKMETNPFIRIVGKLNPYSKRFIIIILSHSRGRL